MSRRAKRQPIEHEPADQQHDDNDDRPTRPVRTDLKAAHDLHLKDDKVTSCTCPRTRGTPPDSPARNRPAVCRSPNMSATRCCLNRSQEETRRLALGSV